MQKNYLIFCVEAVRVYASRSAPGPPGRESLVLCMIIPDRRQQAPNPKHDPALRSRAARIKKFLLQIHLWQMEALTIFQSIPRRRGHPTPDAAMMAGRKLRRLRYCEQRQNKLARLGSRARSWSECKLNVNYLSGFCRLTAVSFQLPVLCFPAGSCNRETRETWLHGKCKI